MNMKFDPQTLADDLTEVSRIYARFFATFDKASWDKPVKGGPNEWTLHETVAHILAWIEAGLESIKHSLRGETYTFRGLDTRYDFNAYNRKRIDEYLKIPLEELCANLLETLAEAANIARNLTPDQAILANDMSIYNRPVTTVEALSILIFHTGLVHTAQVAEAAGLPPLWKQLSPEFRHHVIERMARALSLLYRPDIGGSLRATIAFRVDGPGGGEWYVSVSPDSQTSGEGVTGQPNLVIHLRDTSVFCQMPTSRLNLPLALIRGDIKLRGDVRLFLRMDSLFSVDARPKHAVSVKTLSTSQRLLER
jgi:hypothetical protein